MDFKYRCLDPAGRVIAGNITAVGSSEALSLLKQRDLTVVEINEVVARAVKKRGLRKKVKDEDLYNVFREMSILLKSGIKIDRALEIVVNSSSSMQMRDTLSTILKDIKAGKTIARAFSDTGQFNLLTVTMIHAGESVGDVRSAFENIAEYQRFQIQFKGEIKNALAYPSFLIGASMLVIFVIFKFIIPRFFSIFGKNDATLPVTAKILYSIGNFLSITNVYFILLAVALVFVMLKVTNTRNVLSKAYSYLIYLPLFGSLILSLELSRFSYSMYSMLNSGIAFIDALRLSTGVIMDKKVRESIEPAIDQIKEGKGIADVFSHIHILPEIVANMIRVGEESGNLRDIFLEVHRIFDERFRNTTKRVLALVEPVVITITGIIVGFIVISLILTVMSASDIKL
ncbi:MAG: type II secretion system F family protein [Nitrospirae bacterium]|nr:type II secretion system F family protein [Nitrospirota bacterium]